MFGLPQLDGLKALIISNANILKVLHIRTVFKDTGTGRGQRTAPGIFPGWLPFVSGTLEWVFLGSTL